MGPRSNGECWSTGGGSREPTRLPYEYFVGCTAFTKLVGTVAARNRSDRVRGTRLVLAGRDAHYPCDVVRHLRRGRRDSGADRGDQRRDSRAPLVVNARRTVRSGGSGRDFFLSGADRSGVAHFYWSVVDRAWSDGDCWRDQAPQRNRSRRMAHFWRTDVGGVWLCGFDLAGCGRAGFGLADCGVCGRVRSDADRISVSSPT